MSNKSERRDPAYLREQGQKQARGPKQRNITFSFSKHIHTQGQTLENWDNEGLLIKLITQIKFVGQYTALQARQNNYVKEYTKVEFPPDSEFKEPKHITGIVWAVMHITTNSKEVIAGYIEDDVFQIIFLDKEHKFWPSTLKNT
jgi:hypothetical protein